VTGVVVGLFVGGQSRRMGTPKGLLKAPGADSTLLARLLTVTRSAVPGAALVLTGTNPAYAALPCPQLPDAVAGVGPIGGLLALVRWARARGLSRAVALACDMPYVSAELVARLATACPSQPNLAARVDGRVQPFFARYEPVSTQAVILALLRQHQFSITRVVHTLAAQPLPLSPTEALSLGDWDTPGDVKPR
jgi:molybdopterin-guanine dinucleotide biosynthesis protein A